MGTFLSAFWLLLCTHFTNSLRSKRFWACALISAMPALIAWMAAGRADAIRVAAPISMVFGLQIVGPVVGLVMGSTVVTEEVDNRTLSFVFTRPVPRAAFFLGRLGATLLLLALMLGPSAWAVSTVVGLPREGDTQAHRIIEVQESKDAGHWSTIETLSRRARYRWQDPEGRFHREYLGDLAPGELRPMGKGRTGHDLRAIFVRFEALDRQLPKGFSGRLVLASLLAGALYSLVTAGLGTLVKRPVVYGLGYAFALDGVLANIPGSSQTFSLQYYLRGILVGDSVESFRRFDPIADTEFLSPLGSTIQLGILLVIGTVIACITITRKQYLLTS